MKKIILTAVMSLTLLYVGLIDFSYAEDPAVPAGTEMAEEKVAEDQAPSKVDLEPAKEEIDEKKAVSDDDKEPAAEKKE